MKTIIISANDSNQRLDKFIKKSIPNLPQSLMYKYIRLKKIKVNKKKQDISYILQQGDVLDLYIKDEFFIKDDKKYDFMSSSNKIDVIYEDENILLVNKPAGLLCHPDKIEYNDTLISRIIRYLYEKKEYNPEVENSFTPALVNRIDRNTMGIVIAAKNFESLQILNQQMKKRNIKKYYLCIVHGKPEEKSMILTGYIKKDEEKNKVIIKDYHFPDSKEIRTKYRLIKYDSYKDLSLLEIELLTGRTHQIRAQFSHIGHPLLGDGKYGKNTLNKKFGYKKQCLCSYKLTFKMDSEAKELLYLNGKTFEINNIWFREEFINGNI